MKPMLFSTDMVRALLEGRKSVTRRVIKPQPEGAALKALTRDDESRMTLTAACAPYEPGDVLYVRETWCVIGTDGTHDDYGYRADGIEYGALWRPSIHMPKEAARIFLRVKDVRAERLRDISTDPPGPNNQVVREGCRYESDFIAVWNSTVKPADRDKCGWDANPWVWVIEFERVSREEMEE